MEAKVYGTEPWKETIEAMHSFAPIEVTEEIFDYFLEVLPPVFMGRIVTLPNGTRQYASFGFAEGAENIRAFWSKGGRFFCCQLETMNRC